MKLLIKNGRVIDPASGLDRNLDILIEGSIIKAVSGSINPDTEDTETIDAAGCIVLPGLIDMHVHFREPGREDIETIAGGSKIAAKSGFTTVCTMPNTIPVNDSIDSLNLIKKKSKDCRINILPIASITRGSAGNELTDMKELLKHGAIAFSDDGMPVMNALVMRRALELSKEINVPLITHSEDLNLTDKGVMNEGSISAQLGLRGIPNESEEILIARDVILARLTGGRVHVAHVSSAGSVEIIRNAKEQGVKITAEATPHHFSLTEDEIKTHSAMAKMSPPLRTGKDRLAVIEGLRSGVIDVIATDHAPHLAADKEKGMEQAPFGIIGLETAVPLVITKLVRENGFSVLQAFKCMTANPAGILNIKKGEIKKNFTADITIINPDKKVRIDEKFIISGSKNTPFIGCGLFGSVEYTICSGEIIYKNIN
ncbi:MAG: dihydroorotase [Spirochaetes bacterium]|nr:dihydroorotase [Spirochaetota bacterium]